MKIRKLFERILGKNQENSEAKYNIFGLVDSTVKIRVGDTMHILEYDIHGNVKKRIEKL